MNSFADCSNAFDFTGKRVLITAGAGILGPQFAAGFLQHGAHVAIADINPETLATVAGELEQAYPGRVLAIVSDVADVQSVDAMVERTVEVFGGIDVLLNNAAYFPDDFPSFFTRFEDYSLDQWRKVMSVNIDGMFLVAQRVGRQMLAQGTGGSIVQTSSIYGVMASDQRIYEGSEYLGSPINNPAAYAASKTAVVGLSRWLAAYWADKGIRVNTLAPGGVESGQNETFTSRYGARVPMGRMAKVNEMTSTVLYLASDASSYVTGQCIVVDGGLSAW
ncbi:MAG: SDR family oxidoreductase [Rhodospirillaceae bacterium]|nr:SDR family oxidoreductase [Rhodospirillales bacterium]